MFRLRRRRQLSSDFYFPANTRGGVCGVGSLPTTMYIAERQTQFLSVMIPLRASPSSTTQLPTSFVYCFSLLHGISFSYLRIRWNRFKNCSCSGYKANFYSSIEPRSGAPAAIYYRGEHKIENLLILKRTTKTQYRLAVASFARCSRFFNATSHSYLTYNVCFGSFWVDAMRYALLNCGESPKR